MSSDGRPDVAKAKASSYRRLSFAVPEQDGHLLSGVIGSVPGRAAAMIGRQIVALQSREQFRHPSIERFQSCCVAGEVAPVAVDRVEIDKIGELRRSRRSP
jgi:hypothetical protein